MQGDVILHRVVLQRAGVYNILDFAAGQQVEHMVALPQTVHGADRDAQLRDGLRRALRGVQGAVQVVEPSGQLDDLRIVVIRHAQQDAGLVLRLGHLHARRRQPLEQGLAHILADAQHLARGLHFRAQIGIGVAQLFKGEHRNLHRRIGRRRMQPGSAAQVRQGLPQHHLRRQIHHGHPRHLADIRHGAAGPGIHLDHVQLSLIYQILDVHQSLGAQGQRQLLAGGNHGIHHVVVQREGRIDRDGVAGMDAGPLHVLHDAGDQHVLPVGDDVHLQLRSGHILVHQHRILDPVGQDPAHVGLHVLVLPGDGHVLSADDVAGPQQHRESQMVGRLQGLLRRQHGLAPGPPDTEALQ